MKAEDLPLAYRWFIRKGLTNWQPWHFVDTVETLQHAPRLADNENFARAFKIETRADFDVYLFGRRQDRERTSRSSSSKTAR
jgi:hypothetical protein